MISLLFLGQLTIQAQAFLPFLSEHGYEITVINTSPWVSQNYLGDTNIPVYNLYEGTVIRSLFNGQLEWYRKATYYNLIRTLKLKNGRFKQIINERQVDMIYGSWGSKGLPEMGMAQGLRVPAVYEFLTYPTSDSALAQRMENFLNAPAVNKLDGRVLSTKSMFYYMKSKFGVPRGENLVLMECYPRKFYFNRRLQLLSDVDNQPHVVFIGMDVSDNLPQIQEIARRRIHVHVCDPNQAGWSDESKTHEKSRFDIAANSTFIHTFNKFSYDKIADGTFSTFLTQFDACLVTYNFWKCSSLSRFANSIPSRFAISLLGGIPLIVPEGFLKGCEEILEKHNIGFAYSSYDDLRNKLINTNLIGSCKSNAVHNSDLFSLENHFNTIDKFLKRIID